MHVSGVALVLMNALWMLYVLLMAQQFIMMQSVKDAGDALMYAHIMQHLYQSAMFMRQQTKFIPALHSIYSMNRRLNDTQ